MISSSPASLLPSPSPLTRYRYPTLATQTYRYQVTVFYRLTSSSTIFEYQTPIEATSRAKALKSARGLLIESTPEAIIIHSDTTP